MDSRYTFATAHVHGALYKENFYNIWRKTNDVSEILALLEAVWLPKKIAIIHCRRHQNSESPEAKENAFVDKTVWEVALKPVGLPHILLVVPIQALPKAPVCTVEKKIKGQSLRATKDLEGWLCLPDGRLFLPTAVGQRLIEQVYHSTHLRNTTLTELLQCYYYIPGLAQWTHQVSS